MYQFRIYTIVKITEISDICPVLFNLRRIRQTRKILRKNQNRVYPHGSVGPHSSRSNNRNNNWTIQKSWLLSQIQHHRWMNWSPEAEVCRSPPLGVVWMRGGSQEKRTWDNSRDTLWKGFLGSVSNLLWVVVHYIWKQKFIVNVDI